MNNMASSGRAANVRISSRRARMLASVSASDVLPMAKRTICGAVRTAWQLLEILVFGNNNVTFARSKSPDVQVGGRDEVQARNLRTRDVR
jgi:hypothetical protein